MSLKNELHDRLWRAFERWHELRGQGATKHDLKMQGLREYGDVNHCTRNLIFSANTLHTYEKILGRFLDSCPHVQRLEEIGKAEFRAFMDKAIADGLAVKTLKAYGSALAKLGALTGQTRSFAKLAESYARKVSDLARAGTLRGPSRMTPTIAVRDRMIEILRAWDARHFARMDEPRAYHLAALIQQETMARGISATERITAVSLLDGNRLTITGKGGRHDLFEISPELHAKLRAWFAHNPGPLADLRGYQCAYMRAIRAAGGYATGTHGARRAAAQEAYALAYAEHRAGGVQPRQAADRAAGDVVERLGHSRDRRDHRKWYLGAG
ncbi:MAG: hypothetical protein HYY17_02660 [Planctomycetes bacterium]|nr:hypothetical protein [Planctomycetota bacterium]